MTATAIESAALGVMPRNATTDLSWRHESACQWIDPELFFPAGFGDEARRSIQQAKKICAVCPVRQECLDWAVDTRQSFGVWGGLAEDERQDLYEASFHWQFDRCIARQELIEQRVADRVTQVAIAAELGVSRRTVRKALDYFRFERDALDAASEEVAA
ncbi:WhiB family transcriptional regulator [Streptomyces sp. NPDC058239]|uniref:WhiB family transcriptional regulator n=1 Tax=Streptomyces sp. NPDC058239 TaxID=3346395 RepID=UPI0036E1C9F8